MPNIEDRNVSNSTSIRRHKDISDIKSFLQFGKQIKLH